MVLGRHNARYKRCNGCGFIRAENPTWLDEAYSHAIATSDVGLLRRNVVLAAVTRSVVKAYFNKSGKFVDYGGGYGVLTRFMRDAGLDTYRYDPMCRNLFAAGFDIDPPPQPCYELATAFEVFEHLVNPQEQLQKMLMFSRNILFTTLLQPEPAPRPGSWWYYCLETGQHVAFYTRAALEALAAAHGLHMVSDGVQLHLLTDRPRSEAWFRIITRYRVAALRCPFSRGSTLIDKDHEAARTPRVSHAHPV